MLALFKACTAGFVLLVFVAPVSAQVLHCFDSANGPEVPCTRSGGGGYVAPAQSGPSPTQLAAQRRRAAGLAANNRGIAAFNRPLKGADISSRLSEMLQNYREAQRDFEEALRYLPDDTNIHLSLANTKGLIAQFEGNYAQAVHFFEDALTYAPHNSNITANLRRAQQSLRSAPQMNKEHSMVVAAHDAEEAHDWVANERYLREAYKACTGLGCEAYVPAIHQAMGRQALSQRDWETAIRELKQSESWYVDEEKKSGKYGVSYTEDIRKLQNLIDDALAGKARQQETDFKADEQRQHEQASNPNYPKPPPVYRDATTPRSYPRIGTPSQLIAHDDNETGNLYAQKGDWVEALLNYQKALVEDPDGPFSQVLKDNLAIAMKHLGKEGGQNASGPPVAAQPAPPKQAEEKQQEVTQSNCTGWMTQSGGVSFRLCTDEQGQRHCEQADGKGVASRVSCQ